MALSAMWDCVAVRHKIKPHERSFSVLQSSSRAVLAVDTFGRFHPTYPTSVAAYLDGWDLHANISHPGAGSQGQNSGLTQQSTIQGPTANLPALVGLAPAATNTVGNGAVALTNPAQRPRRDNLPLPSEIADMIFALLPLHDLDTARLTCRDWREHIMSSTWTLKNALGQYDHQHSSHVLIQTDNLSCSNFRVLGRQFDSTVKAKLAKDYSTSCRLRFRRLDLDFSVPRGTKSTFLSAFFWPIGDLMAVLVKETIQTMLGPVIEQKLLIYTFLAAEKPSYLGSVPCPKGTTKIRYIRASNPDHVPLSSSRIGREFEIRVDQEIKRFWCGGYETFSNKNSPFWLEVLGNAVFGPPAAGQAKMQDDRDLKIALEHDGKWVLLDDPLIETVTTFIAKPSKLLTFVKSTETVSFSPILPSKRGHIRRRLRYTHYRTVVSSHRSPFKHNISSPRRIVRRAHNSTKAGSCISKCDRRSLV